jgi:UDP-glucose 4-epimerase
VTRTVLVLGGAGFIGSHVAERFVAAGDRVIVLDGLIAGTGGRLENVQPLLASGVEIVRSDIASAPYLRGLVERSDLVVDTMAWTAHRPALEDPVRDLRLNAESHLHVIRCLPAGKPVIYLGSRGQYGAAPTATITEETPMTPQDVQGIHKLAAESYYRVFAGLRGFHAVSLRIANCFGERQPTSGDDIGLIGNFVRDLLAGREVSVFGDGRRRNLVYARDLAGVVQRLGAERFAGFSAFNYAGDAVRIEAIVKLLVEIVGRGGYRVAAMPHDLARIDVGDAHFSDGRLRALMGGLPATDLRRALSATVDYFRRGSP